MVNQMGEDISRHDRVERKQVMGEQREKDNALQRESCSNNTHPPRAQKGDTCPQRSLTGPVLHHQFPLYCGLWCALVWVISYALQTIRAECCLMAHVFICVLLASLARVWATFLTSSVLTKGRGCWLSGNIPSCVSNPPPPKQHTKCVFLQKRRESMGWGEQVLLNYLVWEFGNQKNPLTDGYQR